MLSTLPFTIPRAPVPMMQFNFSPFNTTKAATTGPAPVLPIPPFFTDSTIGQNNTNQSLFAFLTPFLSLPTSLSVSNQPQFPNIVPKVESQHTSNSSPVSETSKPSSVTKPKYRPSFGKEPCPESKFVPGVDDIKGQFGETYIFGSEVASFLVGGEERLCYTQFIDRLTNSFKQIQVEEGHSKFSSREIEAHRSKLNITLDLANPAQLEELINHHLLPFGTEKCQLIRKTDAERLCAALVQDPSKSLKSSSSSQIGSLSMFNPDRLPPHLDLNSLTRSFHVLPVYHECFGKCRGFLVPAWYTEPNSKCIVCLKCSGLLSPERFVSHFHNPTEVRTCHWGFDPKNWRNYLLLSKTLFKSNFSRKEAGGREDQPRHSHASQLEADRAAFDSFKNKFQKLEDQEEHQATPKRMRLTSEKVKPDGSSSNASARNPTQAPAPTPTSFNKSSSSVAIGNQLLMDHVWPEVPPNITMPPELSRKKIEWETLLQVASNRHALDSISPAVAGSAGQGTASHNRANAQANQLSMPAVPFPTFPVPLLAPIGPLSAAGPTHAANVARQDIKQQPTLDRNRERVRERDRSTEYSDIEDEDFSPVSSPGGPRGDEPATQAQETSTPVSMPMPLAGACNMLAPEPLAASHNAQVAGAGGETPGQAQGDLHGAMVRVSLAQYERELAALIVQQLQEHNALFSVLQRLAGVGRDVTLMPETQTLLAQYVTSQQRYYARLRELMFANLELHKIISNFRTDSEQNLARLEAQITKLNEEKLAIQAQHTTGSTSASATRGQRDEHGSSTLHTKTKQAIYEAQKEELVEERARNSVLERENAHLRRELALRAPGLGSGSGSGSNFAAANSARVASAHESDHTPH